AGGAGGGGRGLWLVDVGAAAEDVQLRGRLVADGRAGVRGDRGGGRVSGDEHRGEQRRGRNEWSDDGRHSGQPDRPGERGGRPGAVAGRVVAGGGEGRASRGGGAVGDGRGAAEPRAAGELRAGGDQLGHLLQLHVRLERVQRDAERDHRRERRGNHPGHTPHPT